MNDHPVFNVANLCRVHGAKYAVFSPGSRNAPLSISFGLNKVIETFVFLDERTAAFIALGLAEASKTPVVLCCTSGTALLNYGPAIAEAFYRGIPLIVLTADRPPEWIDQWDGQTIRQQNVFQNHCKFFAQLPVDTSHDNAKFEFNRSISHAFQVALQNKPGPVHLNIPLREPFYPTDPDKINIESMDKIYDSSAPVLGLSSHDKEKIIDGLARFKRILLVVGQDDLDITIQKKLSRLSEKMGIPVLVDVISNGSMIEQSITKHDWFLMNKKRWKDLTPDLIITVGQSLISKNLKLFLRDSQAIQWHISPYIEYSNPFQSSIRYFQCHLEDFISMLMDRSSQQDSTFEELWRKVEAESIDKLNQSLPSLPFSELIAYQQVMGSLPSGSQIHLANSMAVRYANLIGLRGDYSVVANRGTSGIDGTNGTSVGHALISQKKNILLTGDLGFFYDRNAFLHEYDISNLFIIVFNNFGGGIFDMIPGPSRLGDPIKEKFFNTVHSRDLKVTAQELGLSYYKANDEVTLSLALSQFFDSAGKPKLLEVQTDPVTNEKAFSSIKAIFKNRD